MKNIILILLIFMTSVQAVDLRPASSFHTPPKFIMSANILFTQSQSAICDVPFEVLREILDKNEGDYQKYSLIVRRALGETRRYYPFPEPSQCPNIKLDANSFAQTRVVQGLNLIMESQIDLEICLEKYLQHLETQDLPALVKDYKFTQYLPLYEEAKALTDAVVMDKSTAKRVMESFNNSLLYCE